MVIKMISAESSSNKYYCKNKVTKEVLIPVNILNAVKKLRRHYHILAPKLTPREKTEFEVIPILIKKTLHVSSKQNGSRF